MVRFLCRCCCWSWWIFKWNVTHHDYSRNEGRTQDRVGPSSVLFRAGIAHAGLRNGKMKPFKISLQRNTCALARNERTTIFLSTLLNIFVFKQAVDISRVWIYWLVHDRLKYIEGWVCFHRGVWFGAAKQPQHPKSLQVKHFDLFLFHILFCSCFCVLYES